MNLAEEIAPSSAVTSEPSHAKSSRGSRSPADKCRKIAFTIAEAEYQKIALWCYERGKRVEQIAEELLLAKFAE